MFNLYTHMKRDSDGREQREPETTGHDRFNQERSRSSFKKRKKRVSCRRAQSAAELNPESIAAANKRNAFRMRSVSTDKEESEAEENSEKTPLVSQKIDSIAKLLFNKSIISSPSGSAKASPSTEPGSSPKVGENKVKSAAAEAICLEYLSYTTRYELIAHLEDIGSRSDRHWFAVRDNDIKTERLLTLVPLGHQCPIESSEKSRSLILELFRALQHPYIYPVLDVAFCLDHVLAVIPFNSHGSLKDLIYKSSWSDPWGKKYGAGGDRLPLWQVGRLGRQVLEGLLFLKEKGFPPFRHLHTGNIMLQNGVARISGLDNTLVGSRARCAFIQCASTEHVETLSLGCVLYEMCCGVELDTEPAPAQFQLQLEQYPQVVEVLEYMFSAGTPSLHELLLCELFRKIDLREMKGSCLPNFSQRLSRSCMSLLGEVARRQGAAGSGGGGGVRDGRPGLRSEGSSPACSPLQEKTFSSIDGFNRRMAMVKF